MKLIKKFSNICRHQFACAKADKNRAKIETLPLKKITSIDFPTPAHQVGPNWGLARPILTGCRPPLPACLPAYLHPSIHKRTSCQPSPTMPVISSTYGQCTTADNIKTISRVKSKEISVTRPMARPSLTWYVISMDRALTIPSFNGKI